MQTELWIAAMSSLKTWLVTEGTDPLLIMDFGLTGMEKRQHLYREHPSNPKPICNRMGCGNGRLAGSRMACPTRSILEWMAAPKIK